MWLTFCSPRGSRKKRIVPEVLKDQMATKMRILTIIQELGWWMPPRGEHYDMVERAPALRLGELGLNPRTIMYKLCDLGQIMYPFWALISP